MKPIVAIILLALGVSARADELSIVDVRKNIPLADEEPAYKDFYLAGGSVADLKKNMVVTAVRKLQVRDAMGTQSYGDIEIPVGQLRVLAVFGNVAVAREYKLLSRDEHPMLEQVGLMTGDRIETKGSFIDNKPVSKPKSVSETEAPAAVATRETASTTGAEVPATSPATSVDPAVPLVRTQE